MKAQDRTLEEWYDKISRGEIKLPRFQRFESWDKHRICSLVQTIVHNLPLGITLILEVGEKEKFISRNLETAPAFSDKQPYEHLLDGQQRLTALWRILHNNYEWDTYYVYLEEFDHYDKDEKREDLTVFCRSRYMHGGQKYPLWCDQPAKCLERGFVPTSLFKPIDMQQEIQEWIEQATVHLKPHDSFEELENFLNWKTRVSDRIAKLREVVKHYNLPYLSLPSRTEKDTALNVFINMNTNSKPLSPYDIIVAEVESVMEMSLHDLQESLDTEYPHVKKYSELSDLILTTSALLQNKLPSQRGAWDMDKRIMVENWSQLENGLDQMARFLEGEGIYDRQRLPTNAVLAVLAALLSNVPLDGDKRGKDELLLKKYLWWSFFTDRYENSAATHAYADYMALKKIMFVDQSDDYSSQATAYVPIFKEHALTNEEELLNAEWPKRQTIRGRAILAVTCRLGCLDFATGEKLKTDTIHKRHYHHVYPDALLKKAGIYSFLALNCALIADKTNLSIGSKDPLVYLKDRYDWVSEDVVHERLQSHLIPVAELAEGGYADLNTDQLEEKLRKDFDAFCRRRAHLVMKAVQLLAEGKQLDVKQIYGQDQ